MKKNVPNNGGPGRTFRGVRHPSSPKSAPLSGLHITVGATVGDTSSNQALLAHETRLVKAALLYADKVTLCSLASAMVLPLQYLSQLTVDQQINFIITLAPSIMPPDDATALISKITKFRGTILGRMSPIQRLALPQVYRQINEQWQEFAEAGKKQVEQAGAADLLKAVEHGVLHIHTFQSLGGVDAKVGDCTESMIHEFMDVIGHTLSDDSTYPLLDDKSGDLIRAALAEGTISVSDSGAARGRHGALAAQLLERLPSFEEATIDEVLDIRRHLERPLVRFRSAVISFSDQIKAASWDKDFVPEAQKVFLRDIEPAILEIEDAIKSNSLLMALAHGTAGKPVDLLAKSVLGVGFSHVHFLSHAIMAGIAMTATGGSVAADIYKEWRNKQNAIESNQMFFYYKVGQLFERGHPN